MIATKIQPGFHGIGPAPCETYSGLSARRARALDRWLQAMGSTEMPWEQARLNGNLLLHGT